MAWRMMVQVSLARDAGQIVENHLARVFCEHGLKRMTPETWESSLVTPDTLAYWSKTVLRILSSVAETSGANPAVAVNHFWLCVTPC
jgi:hypothetical protein